MKPEFPRQIFEKYLNVKFNENPSGTSRRDEPNSRLSQICKRAHFLTLYTFSENV